MMINVKNQIPSIYYDASRDFQVLGHLYEVVLNYVKTNADMLYLLPNGIEADTRTTELLASTLGFKLRRNYDKEQLAALVSIFPQLLKTKGTITAINLAGNALLKASGVPGEFSTELKDYVLTIKIPIELSDITLFLDLLPYILPFGLRVAIVRHTVIKQKTSIPVVATSTLRKALPSTTTPHEKFLPHLLGLANASGSEVNGDLEIKYSNYNFSSTDTHEAVAGLFGTSPILAFDTEENTLNTAIASSEEDATK